MNRQRSDVIVVGRGLAGLGRPAALTLTLGEPAHSPCRAGSAR
jgi:hypothetical protein